MHHEGELAPGEVDQVRFDLAAVTQLLHLLVHGVAGLLDRGDDDLAEQTLLVSEVLVHVRLDTAACAAISSMLVPR